MKTEIMNKLVKLLKGDYWKESECLGFKKLYIYKGTETIKCYSSLYEAEFNLKNLLKSN